MDRHSYVRPLYAPVMSTMYKTLKLSALWGPQAPLGPPNFTSVASLIPTQKFLVYTRRRGHLCEQNRDGEDLRKFSVSTRQVVHTNPANLEDAALPPPASLLRDCLSVPSSHVDHVLPLHVCAVIEGVFVRQASVEVREHGPPDQDCRSCADDDEEDDDLVDCCQ